MASAYNNDHKKSQRFLLRNLKINQEKVKDKALNRHSTSCRICQYYLRPSHNVPDRSGRLVDMMSFVLTCKQNNRWTEVTMPSINEKNTRLTIKSIRSRGLQKPTRSPRAAHCSASSHFPVPKLKKMFILPINCERL